MMVPPQKEILDVATDALSMAGVANMEINNHRKEQIKHNLSDKYKGLCSSSAPVTTQLFGDDVTKQVKTSLKPARPTGT